MARWKTPSDALPPFLLAGRIAGLDYVDTLQQWATGDHEAVLSKALATARKKPGGTLQSVAADMTLSRRQLWHAPAAASPTASAQTPTRPMVPRFAAAPASTSIPKVLGEVAYQRARPDAAPTRASIAST